MDIRKAKCEDIDEINRLLFQVLLVHHEGRSDLFRANAKKYTDAELAEIIKDDSKPIFVAVENGNVLGYAFCVFIQHKNDNILTDIKTLYIDDLCVDESMRGQHVGKSLYEYVVEYARQKGVYNITLNVWELNEGAKKFYEKCGLKVQKTVMEMIL